MKIAFIFCLLAALPGAGAPIPGFRPGINFTGFDPTPGGFTYVPITNNANGINQFKQEYLDLLVTRLKPIRGRIMDLQQINDNDETVWANRATTDFGRNGVTHETAIRLSNQMRARIPDYSPQVNTPANADTDYALQMGKLWGANYQGDQIVFGHANEMMFPFGNNLAAQAMFKARAIFPGRGDFDALSLYQGHRLREMYLAFKSGVASVSSKRVVMEVEGFAPVTQYAALQIQQIKAEGGVDLTDARVSIAQYAFGSATDPQGPLGTNAQKRDTTLAFVEDSLKQWTAAHLALAVANGMAPVVDAYEMRLGTLPNGGADWVNFQNTDEQAQIQDQGLRKLVAADGGTAAVLNVEGLFGFPMDAPQGQFPLLGLSQFDDPLASGAYRGVAGVIDFSVPEPNAAVLLLCFAAMLLARGRRAA